MLLGLAAAGALAAPAGAQVQATLDAGAGSARLGEEGSGSIALFAPSLGGRRGLVNLEAGGVYSGMGERGWNAAGLAAAGLRSPRLGAFQVEAAGQYRWSAHAIARGTEFAEAELGLVATPWRWASISVAGKVGSASALGRTRPITGARAGARAVLRGVGIELGIDRTSFTEGRLRPGVVFDSLSPRQDTLVRRTVVEYTDASLGARWQRGSLELAATLARRLGSATLQATSWSLSATRWLTPRLAVVGGAGHYAADPASSLPAGRYATLALRVGVGGHAPAAPENPPLAVEAGFTRARRGADGLVALEVAAPGARAVELMGDFTDWTPVTLARGRGGLWQVRLPIPPGIHRLVVRLDGGAWRPPPGARPALNEFGVPVGAVLVD